MRIGVLSLVLSMGPGAAIAQDAAKQEFCLHQGSIVGALAQAKLDRVPEARASAHVLENATWPAKYNPAVPIYVGEVYKLKRRDLKSVDLAAQWEQACLAN